MSESLSKILAILGIPCTGSTPKDTLMTGFVTPLLTGVETLITSRPVLTDIVGEFNEHIVTPVVSEFSEHIVTPIVSEFNDHIVTPIDDIIADLPRISDIIAEFEEHIVTPTVAQFNDHIITPLETILNALFDEIADKFGDQFDSTHIAAIWQRIRAVVYTNILTLLNTGQD